MLPNETGYIVYDGECPYCSRFVEMLRLRAAIGDVKLVNARDDHPIVAWIREKKIDLNEGLVFIQNGKVSHGHECIHKIALLTSPSDAFNRLNALIFRSDTAARLLYPILRFGRNTTLKLLGRRKLDSAAAPQQ